MRRLFILFAALITGTAAQSQTVATFDSLSLAGTDTFYVNYSASGTDVGFNNGLAHFPCVYDASFGGFWSYGFAYSNMTDSVTSSYTNQYSAKTAIGYGGSAKYAVAYGNDNKVILQGAAMGNRVSGFYVTNNTYAYNSMRDGDGFARKFHNGDWFKLTVRAYSGGILKPDSVGMYLANFLYPDSTMNYILRTWQWVNLLPLGNADSLLFTLSSTDNGSFGMNTPAYFCIDNFTTAESHTLQANVAPAAITAKVYPNPTHNSLFIDMSENDAQSATILNAAGNVMSVTEITTQHTEMNTATLPAGVYLLQLKGTNKSATLRFIKG